MIALLFVYLCSSLPTEFAPFDATANKPLRYMLDISTWQSTFNATKAKANGVSEVVIRAGYGQSKDTCFDKFAKEATSAGLRLGAYVFATYHYKSVSSNYNAAVTNMKAQANTFINHLKTIRVTGMAVLDLEMESSQSTALTMEQLTTLSNQFLDIVKAAGYKAVLYANADWVFNRLVTRNLKHPIWMAYYFRYGTPMDFRDHDGSFPNNTLGNKMRSIESQIIAWQFTSEGYGSKYGVGSTNLDKNYAYY